MSSHPHTPKNQKPTPRQLAYLRALAQQTATSFTYPATARQASAEIRRLKALPATGPGDARREQREVQHDLATRPDDATAIAAHEIAGWGSHAHWAYTGEDPDPWTDEIHDLADYGWVDDDPGL